MSYSNYISSLHYKYCQVTHVSRTESRLAGLGCATDIHQGDLEGFG